MNGVAFLVILVLSIVIGVAYSPWLGVLAFFAMNAARLWVRARRIPADQRPPATRGLLYEGSARVARLSDNYVARTGQIPRTADQLREQEQYEAEVTKGIIGAAALEAQLQVMSPSERAEYINALDEPARSTLAAAMARMELRGDWATVEQRNPPNSAETG